MSEYRGVVTKWHLGKGGFMKITDFEKEIFIKPALVQGTLKDIRKGVSMTAIGEADAGGVLRIERCFVNKDVPIVDVKSSESPPPVTPPVSRASFAKSDEAPSVPSYKLLRNQPPSPPPSLDSPPPQPIPASNGHITAGAPAPISVPRLQQSDPSGDQKQQDIHPSPNHSHEEKKISDQTDSKKTDRDPQEDRSDKRSKSKDRSRRERSRSRDRRDKKRSRSRDRRDRSRSRSRGRRDRRDRSRSRDRRDRSRDRRDKKDRSRSRDRRGKDRSRSRDRRDKKDRKSRSRSRGRRDRRDRSRSRDRRDKNRSRSRDRRGKDRSRSRDRRERGRSKSRDRRDRRDRSRSKGKSRDRRDRRERSRSKDKSRDRRDRRERSKSKDRRNRGRSRSRSRDRKDRRSGGRRSDNRSTSRHLEREVIELETLIQNRPVIPDVIGGESWRKDNVHEMKRKQSLKIPELPPPVKTATDLLSRPVNPSMGPYVGSLSAIFYARKHDVPSGWIELVDNPEAERVYVHQRNVPGEMRIDMILKFRARRNPDGRMDAEDVTIIDPGPEDKDVKRARDFHRTLATDEDVVQVKLEKP